MPKMPKKIFAEAHSRVGKRLMGSWSSVSPEDPSCVYRRADTVVDRALLDGVLAALRGVLPDDIRDFEDLPNVQKATAAIAKAQAAIKGSPS